MVLQVRHTLTRLPASFLYTSLHNTFAFYAKCVTLMGHLTVAPQSMRALPAPGLFKALIFYVNRLSAEVISQMPCGSIYIPIPQ